MKLSSGAVAQKNQDETPRLSTVEVKVRKQYSVAFKQECVRQIDAKETTVSAVMHEHKVTRSAIYKWLAAYSPTYQKAVVVVTELASESGRSKRLEAENKDLLALIGKQQVELTYWKTLIASAEAQYNIDIKKNCMT
jgi:transposase-like protein